jgi:predicted nucleic acid-binding protein
MATMGAKVLVDTNILLRFMVKRMALHQEVTDLVRRVIQDGAALWINGQIIREFIVQATHPRTLNAPLTTAQVLEDVDKIKHVCQVADETAAVREQLLELVREYPTAGKQVHDANLVATMLAYNIDTLLTLNIDDFRRFAERIRLLSLPPMQSINQLDS